MGVVKIWRCRDHHNGGWFNGDCHLDGNGGITAITVAAAFRVRMRFDAFGSGVSRRAVWGAGGATQNDGYMLLIDKSGDNYRPVVRYLDTETIFTDIDLRPDTLYDIQVYISSGVLRLQIRDRWRNDLWEASQSVSASGTLTTNHLFVGATSNNLDACDLPFRGVIFDLMYCVDSGVYVRLVFYKGYGGVAGNVVKDAFGARNATLVNGDRDFWPPRTDISDSVTNLGKLRRETDSWGVPTFTRIVLTCLDTVKANAHDIIEVEETKNDGVNWLYRVERVEQQPNGLRKLHCIDALADLANVLSNRFFTITNAFTTARQDWWSNYAPVTTSGSNYSAIEYHYDPGNDDRCWVSLACILQAAVAFLQLDNLISVNLSELVDEPSPLRYNGGALHYRWLACNLYELIYAGRNSRDDDDSIAMDQMLRKLALMTRFTWLLRDGELRFEPMILGAAPLLDRYTVARRSAASVAHGPHQLVQKRLQNGVNTWDAWDDEDFEELSWHNLSGSFRAYNRVLNLQIPPLLRVWKHDHVSTALLTISPDPLAQLVDVLDERYGKPHTLETTKTTFVAWHDRRHLAKIDDATAVTTEIKQEY